MKVHIMQGMNKLDTKTRAQILAMLCESASMRSVSRLTDTSINTVSKLLVDAGRFCAGFHDAKRLTAPLTSPPLNRYDSGTIQNCLRVAGARFCALALLGLTNARGLLPAKVMAL
jgi:DNA-binding CsgD family transcriptional regulator